jgi:glycosyltransferase involved in cell wall biosynthesis
MISVVIPLYNKEDSIAHTHKAVQQQIYMYYDFSIIIPHKNSLHLLRRCVESIPKRDDIEIIVVDDNSDVTSSEWNLFRKDFPHIQLVLTTEGRGAGYARNVGLSKATGKWLIFADADDYFYPNALNIIDKKIIEADYDIIYFNCDSRDGETGEVLHDVVLDSINVGIINHDCDLLRYKSNVPWGKVIKHSLVKQHNILFEEIEVSNDIMFSTLVGYNSSKIGIIENVLYCYSNYKDSLVHTPTTKRMITRIKAGARVNAFLSEHGINEYKSETVSYTLHFLKKPHLLIWAIWNGRYKGDVWRYSKEVVREIYKAYMWTIKRKVKRFIAYIGIRT